MISQHSIKKYSSIGFLVVIMINACNNKDSADTPGSAAPASKIATSATADSTAGELKSNLIKGFLDILYIDSPSFVSLKKRTVFRFYTNDPDTLTLHGWSSNDNVFTDQPSVKLLKGSQSTVEFGSSSYFGNLILRNADRKEIKRLLDSSHSKFVLFCPDNSEYKQQINYRIILSKDNSQVSYQDLKELIDQADLKIDKAKFVVTKITTNPSPPRHATSEL